MTEQEVEVKFYVNNSAAVEKKLRSEGANLVQVRILELNLRFDTPTGSLTKGGRVLRLRQEARAVMTYKGPSLLDQQVSMRQEIEFNVSDFTAARHLLEALGFQVAVIYEKYRTTYVIDRVEIVIDEMPFGDFVEIEGPEPDSIQAVAQKLGLNWENRSTDSYIGLFSRLHQKRNFPFRDLTFANFEGIKVEPEELGLRYAD